MLGACKRRLNQLKSCCVGVGGTEEALAAKVSEREVGRYGWK